MLELDRLTGPLPSVAEFAKMIDHSILLPTQTDADLVRGVEIALKYNVKCVVPKPYQAKRTKELLEGSDVWLCLAVGFPQGLNDPRTKRLEAELAINAGARELDMVINISALKSGEYAFVERDIAGVVEVASARKVPVKVILETFLLTDEEKRTGCKIAEAAGALFVKTSTATQPGGATIEDIKLMRESVSPHITVKASAFVTTIDIALPLYWAGAHRFGTGFTEPILEGLKKLHASAV